MEYKVWWGSLELSKKESARNFDNQLHYLQSIWPMLDENNEPILTGYKPITPELRKLILKRDHYTCRICCRRQFYCIGEEKRNIISWHTNPNIDLQVHHIIPLPTGPNEPDNLMALCKTCHELLHAYISEDRKDRGIIPALLHTFHKCLRSVPIALPLPEYSPVLVDVIDSFFHRKFDELWESEEKTRNLTNKAKKESLKRLLK
jgi:hypothetical protein